MSDGEWVFECAEPEAGLSEWIGHGCEANADDPEAAEVVTVALLDDPDGKHVNETTTFRCPRCGEMTTVTDSWPIEHFEVTR